VDKTTPILERLTGEQVKLLRSDIAEVYQAAFSAPPYNKTGGDLVSFLSTFTRHSSREGFTCFVVRDGDGGQLLGFAYGYTSQKGQWWHDQVASALDPTQVQYWLSNAFEFVELAVQPSHQGKGIGSRLHDALLTDLPHHTAMLSTMQAETAGLRLYRKRGWEIVIENFIFTNIQEAYIIMGKKLG
jgi:ribosomal protein S18 acetylase RimI-like enzyme